MAPRLAFVGLGNMGRGMARNLAERSSHEGPVLLLNRTHQRAIDLEAEILPGKSHATSSFEELAALSDIIFFCMTGKEAIMTTLSHLLAYDVSGKVFVDTANTDAEAVTSNAEQIEGKGASFVYCPAFGPEPAARNGTLIFAPAGPAAAVLRIKPYLDGVMGRFIIDMSDDAPAHAALLKTIGNILVLATLEGLAETHTFAEKVGLRQDRLHMFVEAMFPGLHVFYSDRMRSGEYWTLEKPLSAASTALGQVQKTHDLSDSVGMELGLVKMAIHHLQRVEDVMGDQGDVAAIYGAVREKAGLKFKKDVQ